MSTIKADFMTNRSLRICLIGNLSGPDDEGMKKASHKFALTLKEDHTVLPLHVRSVFSLSFWRKLKEFRPEVIFYVGGPSFLTFALAAVARIYCKLAADIRPRVVIFALHPLLPSILERASALIQPDFILVQSYRSQNRFRSLGMHTRFLPIGVDLEKFAPVDSSEKMRLRGKYGVSTSEFVVLHVGSVRKNRGLKMLTKVQMKEGNRVLIVGSTSMPMDRVVFTNLISSGCLVWRRHFPDIQELYQLADMYAFPVIDMLGSVEIPLSVLEAMACNLPVVLTKFGALPRILEEEDGLVFVDKADDIPLRIEQIKTEHLMIKTRDRVTQYSWENVTQSLVECFCQLVEEEEN